MLRILWTWHRCTSAASPKVARTDLREAFERDALPGRELRRRAGDEPTAHRALAGAAAFHVQTDWLQAPRVLPRRDAHEHLLDDAPIEWISGRHRFECGQRDLAAGGAH